MQQLCPNANIDSGASRHRGGSDESHKTKDAYTLSLESKPAMADHPPSTLAEDIRSLPTGRTVAAGRVVLLKKPLSRTGLSKASQPPCPATHDPILALRHSLYPDERRQPDRNTDGVFVGDDDTTDWGNSWILLYE